MLDTRDFIMTKHKQEIIPRSPYFQQAWHAAIAILNFLAPTYCQSKHWTRTLNNTAKYGLWSMTMRFCATYERLRSRTMLKKHVNWYFNKISPIFCKGDWNLVLDPRKWLRKTEVWSPKMYSYAWIIVLLN